MSDVDGHYLDTLETDNLKKEWLKKLIDEPAKLWSFTFHDNEMPRNPFCEPDIPDSEEMKKTKDILSNLIYHIRTNETKKAN